MLVSRSVNFFDRDFGLNFKINKRQVDESAVNVTAENKSKNTEDSELQQLRREVSQLTENYQFLLHYYRIKVTEKSEELAKLKRIHSDKTRI